MIQKSSISSAKLVKVIPAAHRGQAEITQLQRTDVPSGKQVLWFSYQRDKFVYDPATNSFSRLAYPCDNPDLTIGDYKASRGLDSAKLVEEHKWEYGKNLFDIPIPSFKELFSEHAVAPFFVFQIFCVGLWCLDEYWYYSLFTLFMLIVFECTVVFQVGSHPGLSNPTTADMLFQIAPKNTQRVQNYVYQAISYQRLSREQLERDPDR
jgi:cation-transporting ATPase 13A1